MNITGTALLCQLEKNKKFPRKQMHWVVYNLWYIVLDLLGRDEEAERIFAEAEKFLSEAKLNEELFRLYNLKVVIMFSFYPSFQF